MCACDGNTILLLCAFRGEVGRSLVLHSCLHWSVYFCIWRVGQDILDHGARKIHFRVFIPDIVMEWVGETDTDTSR